MINDLNLYLLLFLLLLLQCLINQLSENDKQVGIVKEFFLMGINQTVKQIQDVCIICFLTCSLKSILCVMIYYDWR